MAICQGEIQITYPVKGAKQLSLTEEDCCGFPELLQHNHKGTLNTVDKGQHQTDTAVFGCENGKEPGAQDQV